MDPRIIHCSSALRDSLAGASFARLHATGDAVHGLRRGTPIGLGRCSGPMIRVSKPSGADIRETQSVADAVAGVHGVVNAVSLYTDRGTETFHLVHVECAERVAMEAHRAGIEHLVHVSGIGADPASGSSYVRSRGQGELAVRAAHPGAILIRPAVMFGPDDAFLTVILELLQRLPAYPMFGSGVTNCSRPMWRTSPRQLPRIVQGTELWGPKDAPNVVDRGSTLTKSFSTASQARLVASPSCSQSRSRFGMRWPAQQRSCRAHPSREISSSSCRLTPWRRRSCRASRNWASCRNLSRRPSGLSPGTGEPIARRVMSEGATATPAQHSMPRAVFTWMSSIHKVKLPRRRSPASYAGQFCTLNDIFGMWWRRSALCLCGMGWPGQGRGTASLPSLSG